MINRIKDLPRQGVQAVQHTIDESRAARRDFGRKVIGYFGVAFLGFLGAIYISTKNVSSADFTNINSQSVVQEQSMNSEQSVDVEVQNAQYDLIVQPFYFNPIRGGVNCNDDCRFTRSNVRVLEDDYKTPFGPFWWDPSLNEGGAACPENMLGYTLEALLPNGEKATFYCFDTGGDIIEFTENGQPVIRIDILYEDGYGPDSGKIWNHPKTAEGYKLTDDLRLEARVIAQP